MTLCCGDARLLCGVCSAVQFCAVLCWGRLEQISSRPSRTPPDPSPPSPVDLNTGIEALTSEKQIHTQAGATPSPFLGYAIATTAQASRGLRLLLLGRRSSHSLSGCEQAVEHQKRWRLHAGEDAQDKDYPTAETTCAASVCVCKRRRAEEFIVHCRL